MRYSLDCTLFENSQYSFKKLKKKKTYIKYQHRNFIFVDFSATIATGVKYMTNTKNKFNNILVNRAQLRIVF